MRTRGVQEKKVKNFPGFVKISRPASCRIARETGFSSNVSNDINFPCPVRAMHVSWQVFNLLSIDSNVKREGVFNFVLDTLYRFPRAEPSRYALDPRLRSSSLG